MITDRRGNIEYVNPAFTTITGYSAADAIGRTPNLKKSGKLNKSGRGLIEESLPKKS